MDLVSIWQHKDSDHVFFLVAMVIIILLLLNCTVNHCDAFFSISSLLFSNRCTCGNCDSMPQEVEGVCCSEIPEIAAKIKLLLEGGYTEENLSKCITKHPGFDAVCINRWALEGASWKLPTYNTNRNTDARSVQQMSKLYKYLRKQSKISCPNLNVLYNHKLICFVNVNCI